MPDVRVIPGTLTNVTPEIDAPIIPIATIHQLDRRSPLKKAKLLPRRVVKRLNANKKAKYMAIVISIGIASLLLFVFFLLDLSQ